MGLQRSAIETEIGLIAESRSPIASLSNYSLSLQERLYRIRRLHEFGL